MNDFQIDNLKLDCLILAAGSASRFGGCKLLADWQGQPLIAATIAAARTLELAQITIVGGAFYPQLLQAMHLLKTGVPEVELLKYRDWELGMGHSLAFGVGQLPTDNAVLILLADQPLVSSHDLQNLYRAWCENPKQITCASFANTVGVPAIFPAQFKAQLLTCTGDRGAKTLLVRYKQQLVLVPMVSAEFDVDTQSDLDDLRLKNVV